MGDPGGAGGEDGDSDFDEESLGLQRLDVSQHEGAARAALKAGDAALAERHYSAALALEPSNCVLLVGRGAARIALGEKHAGRPPWTPLWRVVYRRPRGQVSVAVRKDMSTKSKILSGLAYGEEVLADGEPTNGWITLLQRRGFVMVQHPDLGTLIERVVRGPEALDFAFEDCRRAIELQPRFSEAYLCGARCLSVRGDLELAEELLNRGCSTVARRQRAKLATQLRNLQNAKPKLVEAESYLSANLQGEDRGKRALGFIKEAARLGASAVQTRPLLLWALLQSRDGTRADEAVELSEEIWRSSVGTPTPEVRLWRGAALLLARRCDEARLALRALIEEAQAAGVDTAPQEPNLLARPAGVPTAVVAEAAGGPAGTGDGGDGELHVDMEALLAAVDRHDDGAVRGTFQRALLKGDEAFVRDLVRVIDADGNTLLHRCAIGAACPTTTTNEGGEQIAHLLLALRADVDAVNLNQQTALDLVVAVPLRRGMVQLLLGELMGDGGSARPSQGVPVSVPAAIAAASPPASADAAEPPEPQHAVEWFEVAFKRVFIKKSPDPNAKGWSLVVEGQKIMVLPGRARDSGGREWVELTPFELRRQPGCEEADRGFALIDGADFGQGRLLRGPLRGYHGPVAAAGRVAARLAWGLDQAPALASEGDELLRQRRWDDALVRYEACREAASWDREMQGALNAGTAAALRHLGQPGDALRHASLAAKLCPRHAGAHFWRGVVHYDAGRWGESSEDLQRAKRLGCALPDLEAWLRRARRAQEASGRKDYYRVLGLLCDCGADDVKRRYRLLARECHPDKIHSACEAVLRSAEARFKAINEAHEVLSNAKKRSEYDFGR